MKIPAWLWVVAAVVFFGGGTAVYVNARGLRNNNPGNIREPKGDPTQWVGDRATDDDPAFEEFLTMWHGVRAAAVLFKNYQSTYGLGTIAQLITRWAPPKENDTAAYIKAVSDAVGVN